MSNKPGNNDKCPYCDSGLKYKKCCKNKKSKQGTAQTTIIQENDWMQRVSNLPFGARIYSKNAEESFGMTISSAKITKDGVTTELLNDVITLSTNQVSGDKTDVALASISIPQNVDEKSEFIIIGNATITNPSVHYSITPFAKHKIVSEKGIKAQIKISKQYEPFEFDFFDVLILTGAVHPHITFFPDGNGKYFGQRGMLCNLTTSLNYAPIEKKISPSEISIEIENLAEKLIMKFEFDNNIKTVTLVDQYFI
ncbi:MAG: hypothetical protein PSX42_07425 [bacterium]|nr:hypothetical protein [bacterium]